MTTVFDSFHQACSRRHQHQYSPTLPSRRQYAGSCLMLMNFSAALVDTALSVLATNEFNGASRQINVYCIDSRMFLPNKCLLNCLLNCLSSAVLMLNCLSSAVLISGWFSFHSWWLAAHDIFIYWIATSVSVFLLLNPHCQMGDRCTPACLTARPPAHDRQINQA